MIIGHLNKREKTRTQYRGLGSIDIYAAARSVLMVGKIGETMRVVVHDKSNLAKNGPPIAFSFDSVVGFTWHGEFEINMDDLFDNTKQANESQFSKAKRLIETTLANGPIEAAKIMEMAVEEDISPRTLKRAKSELGVNSVKRNDKWYWEMPVETRFANYDEGCQECQSEYMTPLALLPASEVI